MTKPFLVLNDDLNHFIVTYVDNNDPLKRESLQSQWKTFNRYDPAMRETYQLWCRLTNSQMEVTVDRLLPEGALPGRYRIETFIPGAHAKSKRTIFSVTHNIVREDLEFQEETTLVVLDLSDKKDVWCSLGEYELDPSLHSSIGKVRQYDLSLEDPRLEVSFGPVRWIPLFPVSGKKNRL